MQSNRSIFIILLIALLAAIGSASSNFMLLRLAVLGVVLWCVYLGKKEPSFLNPYYLFVICPVSLLIYKNIGSFYMLDLIPRVWLLSIMNMVAFIAGVWITSPVANNVEIRSIIPYHRLALLFLFIGLIPDWYLAITKTILPLASILSIFSGLSLMCAIASKKRVLILFVISMQLIPIVISQTSKTFVLYLCIAIMIGLEKYYLSWKGQRKLYILSGIVAVIMVLSFGFANKDRGNYDADSSIDYYEQNGVEWGYDASLFLPYMYLETPWSNLQYVVETQDERTYGLWALKPLLGYLQIDDKFTDQRKIRAFSNFNTFTFIAVEFKDFGFWGSLILSFLLGFFVKKVYSRYLISSSPLDAACYVYTAQATFEMFFSNHFFMQSYPFTVFIIVAVYKLLFGKR